MEWMAIAVIDGWDNGWRHTGEILSALTIQTNRQVLTQVTPDSHKRAHDSMVWDSGYQIAERMSDFSKKAFKRRQSGMNPDQAQSHFRRLYGN